MIKIGILGGGQLGKMLLQAGMNYDAETAILDPDPDAPCANYCNRFVVGNYQNKQEVIAFGKNLDVITIEIENVNTDALKELRENGVKIYPSPEIIELIQDKGKQKDFLAKHDIPTATYFKPTSVAELKSYPVPFILKSRKGGYDGKGVYKINSLTELEHLPDTEFVYEECIKVQKELAVMVARNQSGDIQCYDPVEMVFNPQANLVEELIFPSEILKEHREQIMQLGKKIIESLNMTGILAIELFLTEKGEILVNELSPRPHNSGHYSIEACATSQYEQLFRILMNLPMGATELQHAGMMMNVLGEKGYTGKVKYQGIEETLKLPNVYVHIYGKKITKQYRKMGHITILESDKDKMFEKRTKIKNYLKVIA